MSKPSNYKKVVHFFLLKIILFLQFQIDQHKADIPHMRAMYFISSTPFNQFSNMFVMLVSGGILEIKYYVVIQIHKNTNFWSFIDKRQSVNTLYIVIFQCHKHKSGQSWLLMEYSLIAGISWESRQSIISGFHSCSDSLIFAFHPWFISLEYFRNSNPRNEWLSQHGG
jgi:hypothetical protein